MSYETIEFEMRGAVAWLTVNRPEAYNALDLTMAKELCDLSIRLSEDGTVRAVVMTGSGDTAFCAGGDVPGFAADMDALPTLLKEMTTYLHMAISRFAWMRAPVIAAVNGVAAGAGLSFVACADLANGVAAGAGLSFVACADLAIAAGGQFYLGLYQDRAVAGRQFHLFPAPYHRRPPHHGTLPDQPGVERRGSLGLGPDQPGRRGG